MRLVQSVKHLDMTPGDPPLKQKQSRTAISAADPSEPTSVFTVIYGHTNDAVKRELHGQPNVHHRHHLSRWSHKEEEEMGKTVPLNKKLSCRRQPQFLYNEAASLAVI